MEELTIENYYNNIIIFINLKKLLMEEQIQKFDSLLKDINDNKKSLTNKINFSKYLNEESIIEKRYNLLKKLEKTIIKVYTMDRSNKEFINEINKLNTFKENEYIKETSLYSDLDLFISLKLGNINEYIDRNDKTVKKFIFKKK